MHLFIRIFVSLPLSLKHTHTHTHHFHFTCRERLVNQAILVKGVLKAFEVPQEVQDSRVHKVHRVAKGLQVAWEIPDQGVRPVPVVTMELTVTMVRQEAKVQEETKVKRENLEAMDHQDHRVCLVYKDNLDNLDLMGNR